MSLESVSLIEKESSDSSSDIDRKEVLVDALKSAFENLPKCKTVRLKGSIAVWPKTTPIEAPQFTPSVDSNLSNIIKSYTNRKSQVVDKELAKPVGVRWWNEESIKAANRGWFEMPSSDFNDDLKRDLEVLSMRGAFNPKRHYKNLEKIKTANWVQVGTVLDNPVEGRSGQLPNHLRKRTLTQEWLADPEMGKELQKRFKKITVR
eukprot:g6465.t1